MLFRSYRGTSPFVAIYDGTPNYAIDQKHPSSKSIDGWQKVEFEFEYDGSNHHLLFNGGDWGALFDDVRIFPSNANMKSYVYDHVNNRMSSELDENNFATFYEYDNEGNLSQVKRETLSGIISVSETRQSTNKR